MTLRLRSIALSSLLVLTGVAQGAALSPEQLGFAKNQTRDTVLAQCKHIAIIPPNVPIFPGVDPSASAKLETAGSRALQDAGFNLIGAEAYSAARQQVIQNAGGLYFSGTGFKRVDVLTKALDAGMKALMSTPQLDCFVSIRAERSKALVANRYAYFNGVKDYVDGKANSAMSEFFHGATGTGSIGSISLELQIYDRNEKQLFGRFGGVQLLTYLDHQHGDNHGNYLTVPPEALLQDDQRIGRAFATIMVPLRWTPEQIYAGQHDPKINAIEIDLDDFPKPPAGLHQIDKPLLVPREQIMSSVHRVVLGTLAPHDLTSSPEVAARYRSLVHDQLAKLGWEVIDVEGLNTAFGAAVQQVGGIYDPVTGMADPQRLKSVVQRTFNSLALPAAPDSVAFISLVRTTATQVGGDVDWDGTRQSALTLRFTDNTPGVSGSYDLNAGEGAVNAASFSFTLRDANGTLLVDSRGGIQLLQQLSLQRKIEFKAPIIAQTYTNLTPDQLFTDKQRDAHAVAMALRPLSPPSPTATVGK